MDRLDHRLEGPRLDNVPIETPAGLPEVAFEALATTLPLLNRMRSPSIRQRHWKQLMEIGQVTFTVTAEMLLEDVLVLPFNSMPDDIASIAVNADKELLIEEMLERVEKVWTEDSSRTLRCRISRKREDRDKNG